MSTTDSFEGIIYKLLCFDADVKACYIGSTKNITSRLNDHKCNTNLKSRKEHNSILYETIRNTGGWDNWTYQILAKLRVKNYTELHKFEALYIKSTNNTLNKIIPTRTRKQHYEEERLKILAYKKSYHQNNREKILEKRRKRYQKNKEMNKKRAKAYYTINKDKISEQKKLKRLWLDGSETSYGSNRFRHLKSKKYKEGMKKFTETLRTHLASKFPHLNCLD